MRHRLMRVLILLVVAATAIAVPAREASAGPATLDCSKATDGGRWGIYFPLRAETEPLYWSRFYKSLEGVSSASGYGWRHSEAWFAADSQTGYWWTERAGQHQLSPGWAFSGIENSGRITVWEYQWYPATNTYNWEYLGFCDTYQFFVFIPFAG